MADLNLTPEEQFILTCLRTEFSGNGDVDFSAFDFKSFDWDHVYKRSRQWRVAPLLYKAIKNRLVAPNSPLIKGDSGGCCPLNPVVSAHPNEEKTVPLWRGRGEDFAGCQKPHISEYVTVQPPPLTPPTRGGEVDIGELVPTRGGEADVGKIVPTGSGGVDIGKLAPTRGVEVDVGELVPTGDGEADIGKFAQTGSRHIPSPLMGEGKGGGELFPKHFLEKLKLEYIITSIANSKIYDTLSEIGNAFNKAGIPFILLKGSHLAQFVYQDIGLRPMGDIDILVKKEDLQKAETVLLQSGYNNQHNAAKTKSHLHLPYFIHPKGRASLEVHWTIAKPLWQFNIDIEGLWERAEPLTMNGTDILVLSREDIMLYTTLHAVYQHNLRALGLTPYCDIAAIIQNPTSINQFPLIPRREPSVERKGGSRRLLSPAGGGSRGWKSSSPLAKGDSGGCISLNPVVSAQSNEKIDSGGCENTNNNKEVITQEYYSYQSEIDWDQLRIRAQEWGIGKYLHLALRLSHELLGARIPTRILQAIHSEPLSEIIISEAKKRILSVKGEKSPFTDAPHLFYDDFHPHNNFMRRMLFAFRSIFIPPEKLAAYYSLPVNSKRVHFYYGIRFFSLPYRYILYYAQFSFYWLTHKKGQVYGDNLDLWLLSSKRK